MEKYDIEYYVRKSGIIVRVIDGVTLQYLDDNFEWITNQEWYKTMFIDGDDEYDKLTKDEVKEYINNKRMNLKKLIR